MFYCDRIDLSEGIDSTKRISEKAVDACLPALKFVPHWFVAPKMLEYTDNAVLFNDDINFDHGDPD